MKTLILVLLPIVIYSQSLNSFEFRKDMLIVFAEHQSYKAQSEIVDSIANELTKAKQIIWLKDLENKNQQDKIIIIEKKYEGYEPKREWYDNFTVGFFGSVFLIILTYVGLLIF